MSLSQLKDSQMGAIQHPGNPITQRHQAQLCHTIPIPLLLKGGQSLHDAIIKELSVHNITSAYITLNNAQMDTLRYVIPGDFSLRCTGSNFNGRHSCRPPRGQTFHALSRNLEWGKW